MIDVVGVGANSIDFVYRLPAYPRPDSPFAKLPITEHLISCGGQVTTALATCAAMGLSTSYVGTIGSDAHGQRMREELQRRGIDISNVVIRDAAIAPSPSSTSASVGPDVMKSTSSPKNGFSRCSA